MNKLFSHKPAPAKIYSGIINIPENIILLVLILKGYIAEYSSMRTEMATANTLLQKLNDITEFDNLDMEFSHEELLCLYGAVHTFMSALPKLPCVMPLKNQVMAIHDILVETIHP